jgi:hypothetical protein
VLTDPRAALKLARAIRHPWYRCQSLAKVAEHWGTKRQRLELLEEALEAAQQQDEINRKVTVSAWPMKLMVSVAPENAKTHLQQLVDQADGEEHSLRRADALYALAKAVQSSELLLEIVMPSLSRALQTGRGWRIDRLIRFTIDIVKGSMPLVARDIAAHHSDGGKKQALLASLGAK